MPVPNGHRSRDPIQLLAHQVGELREGPRAERKEIVFGLYSRQQNYLLLSGGQTFRVQFAQLERGEDQLGGGRRVGVGPRVDDGKIHLF